MTKGCGGRVSSTACVKIAREAGFKSAVLLILHEIDSYFTNTTLEGEKVIYQGPHMEEGQALPTPVSL